MYQYQIKSGNEGRIFAGDGVRNLGNGIVESDYELTSSYLEPVTEQPQQDTTPPIVPTTPPQTPNPAPVVQPVAANPQPAVTPVTTEQTTNTEGKQ